MTRTFFRILVVVGALAIWAAARGTCAGRSTVPQPDTAPLGTFQQVDVGTVKQGRISWQWVGGALVPAGTIELDPKAAAKFRSFYVTQAEYNGDYTLRFVLQRQVTGSAHGAVVGFQGPGRYCAVVFTGREDVRIVSAAGGDEKVLASRLYRAPVYIPNYVDVVVRGGSVRLRLNGTDVLYAPNAGVTPGRVGFFVDDAVPLVLREVELHRGDPPAVYVPLVVCKQPYVLWATGDEAILMWETNRPVRAVVRYGPVGGSGKRVVVPSRECLQKVVLKGLRPNTAYQFEVECEGQVLGTGGFHSDVGPDRPFSVGVLGDNRTEPTRFERINRMMMRHRPHLVINVGDVVTTGSVADQWDTEYFTPSRDVFRFAPCYVSIGNHEGNSRWFKHFLPYPGTLELGEVSGHYYAFTYGNAAFAAFDNYCDFKSGSAQYAWLEKTLASDAFKKATWRIVFCHEPAYSVGWKGWPGNRDVEKHILPLLEKHGVDMFIAGHTHSYERGVLNGVVHIINGGGGSGGEDFGRNWPHVQRFGLILQYSIMQIDGDRLEFTCYDYDDRVFDRFVLKKGEPLTMPGQPVIHEAPADGPVGMRQIVVSYPEGGSKSVRYRVAIKERRSEDGFWEPTPRRYRADEKVALDVQFKEPGTYHVMVQALDEMLRPSGWAETRSIVVTAPGGVKT
ncbi:MAG: metallophosphoesterase [Armatimonadota bacterium]